MSDVIIIAFKQVNLCVRTGRVFLKKSYPRRVKGNFKNYARENTKNTPQKLGKRRIVLVLVGTPTFPVRILQDKSINQN